MGATLGKWLYSKSTYGPSTGSSWVTVDLQSNRVEQIAVKENHPITRQISPNNYSSTSYPLTTLYDWLEITKTFRINGTLSDSGTRCAVDRKRIITDMFDHGGTGSLCLNLVTNASGTSTGSENYIVGFMNYNFINEGGEDFFTYQMSLVKGKMRREP